MPRIERPRSVAERLSEPEREAEISAAIRLDLGTETDLVLWRQSVGFFQVLDERTQQVRGMRAGLPNGSSDLIGVLRTRVVLAEANLEARVARFGPSAVTEAVDLGRIFALEVKTPRGVVSERQERWISLVRRFGGFASVVRSVTDARAALERARSGLCE